MERELTPLERKEYWTTADGRMYQLREMGDQHLYNAYKYICKRGGDGYFFDKWRRLFLGEMRIRKLNLAKLEEKHEESLIQLEIDRIQQFNMEMRECNGMLSEVQLQTLSQQEEDFVE